METIVKLESIKKSFENKIVLQDFNLNIEQGEFIIVTGESGCGKSTLLNMIGLLDKPDSGKLWLFDEMNVKPFSKKAERLLRDKIGYLFQNYALIENETVYNNLQFVVQDLKNKKSLIKETLQKVHLDGYENKKVYQCSGGEQQRIAIARLMLKPCELVLADEPTGSLDVKNKTIVLDLLLQLHKQGKTIVLVTHDLDIVNYGTRHLSLDL